MSKMLTACNDRYKSSTMKVSHVKKQRSGKCLSKSESGQDVWETTNQFTDENSVLMLICLMEIQFDHLHSAETGG